MLSHEYELTLKNSAQDIRVGIMHMIGRAKLGHVGGSLSIADLMAVLYGGQLRHDPKQPRWDGRDRIVLSKGHAGPAMYAALALRGFFPMEWLDTLNQPPTNLPSHTDRTRTPGVDMTTGSLGQGASSAAGIALAGQLAGKDYYTYLILGDGECEEGQVWEAAMFAVAHKLERLIAFVDFNGKQIDGTIEEIAGVADFEEKFASFGWNVISVADGNDVRAIWEAVEQAKATLNGKPVCIVLHTVKGKGWKFAEDAEYNHCWAIDDAQTADALRDFEAARVQKGDKA